MKGPGREGARGAGGEEGLGTGSRSGGEEGDKVGCRRGLGGARDEGPARRPVGGREGAGGVCVWGVSLVVKGTEADLLCFLTYWEQSVNVSLFFPVSILLVVRRGCWWGDGSGEGGLKPLKNRR